VKYQVAVGASSFAAEDKVPLALLEQWGVEVHLNPFSRRLTKQETVEFYRGKHGILAGLEPLDGGVLKQLAPPLKALARIGIGMSNVDVAAAQALGIKVSNTPDGPTEAVAEMTLAAMLAISRCLVEVNSALHQRAWPKPLGRSLRELTCLIVGYGRIGQRVADLLHGLGCRVLICDPALAASPAPERLTLVSLHAGLAEANVVSLHASGHQAILGDKEFAAMRPGTVLLNSARGELVDESALVRAVTSGRVANCWFDAYWQEPYKGPLADMPQAILTPHIATYTRRCRLSMETEAVRNLLRDLEVPVPAA